MRPVVIILVTIFLTYLLVVGSLWEKSSSLNQVIDQLNPLEDVSSSKEQLHPLSIEALRKREYPGSDLVIEQTLEPGASYQRYLTSYKSEGLKIYALLTIPNGKPPVPIDSGSAGGWPAIIFNHGYIRPQEYSTTERYAAFTDAFSRSGYVLFKPDFRGHGNSEGQATGGYGSNGYTVDVLNAVSSIKKYPGVNAQKIGMWGHSMGGHITLKNMVVSQDIKVGVIWAGVVVSYPDLLNSWRRRSTNPPPSLAGGVRRWRETLVEQYGTPEENPQFWNSISANSYLQDISGPLQLHHGTADQSVPLQFSQKLYDQLKEQEKKVEIFTYQGDDHNLSANLGLALQRSVEFFERYLK